MLFLLSIDYFKFLAICKQDISQTGKTQKINILLNDSMDTFDRSLLSKGFFTVCLSAKFFNCSSSHFVVINTLIPLENRISTITCKAVYELKQ